MNARLPFHGGMRYLLVFLIGISSPGIFAQGTTPPSREEWEARMAKINVASEVEWHRAIDLLKIELPGSLSQVESDVNRPKGTFQRSGSSNWYDSLGNTYVRTAWGTWNNYDEGLANPYPVLPDPLRCADSRAVEDSVAWWTHRRPEIESFFSNEIFGKVPEHLPAVHWTVVRSVDSTVGNIPVVAKRLLGVVDNSLDTSITVGIDVLLMVPARAAHPVPVVMEFGFMLPPGFVMPPSMQSQDLPWEQQVLSRGWGAAIYIPTSVQPDNAAGLTEGIIGLANQGRPRSASDWGALRAWAWGAGRVLDYFEKEPSVDAHRVAIEGVSRYGKAVLVAMAYDARFAVGLVASSGKGGASLYRRNFGETMYNLCSSGGFHWFAANLLKYVRTPDAMPVDSHMLIAMCAPRPVFVSCGSPLLEGRWVDNRGQFMATAGAVGVYALLGREKPVTLSMPPTDSTVLLGSLAFRQHHGGHTVGPNWPSFLDFAQPYFKKP